MSIITKIEQPVNMVTFPYLGRSVDWKVIDARLYRGLIYLYIRSHEINLTKWVQEPRGAQYWSVQS